MKELPLYSFMKPHYFTYYVQVICGAQDGGSRDLVWYSIQENRQKRKKLGASSKVKWVMALLQLVFISPFIYTFPELLGIFSREVKRYTKGWWRLMCAALQWKNWLLLPYHRSLINNGVLQCSTEQKTEFIVVHCRTKIELPFSQLRWKIP